MTTPRPSSTRRSLRVSLLAVAALALATAPAFAQHRAKLSRGLTSQVRDGRPDMRVLYEGPKAEADRLAKEYGLKVRARFTGGAVLTGTSAQFDAAAVDPNVHAITEDGRVQGTMATTTQSTGASQLWGRGLRNFGGLTGRGVTVAVIDSGVDRQPPGRRAQPDAREGLHRRPVRATSTATARTWRGSSPGAAAGSGRRAPTSAWRRARRSSR